MTVEIQSIGKTEVFQSEFAPVAMQFFAIPALAEGRIALEAALEPLDSGVEIVFPLKAETGHWYLLLADSKECEIEIRGGQVMLRRAAEMQDSIQIFLLDTDQKHQQKLTGPYLFSA